MITSTPAPLEPAVMPVTPDPIVKGVPHGSDILHIAVTDDGRAALTADATNSLRLWPTLDGTRTPVPLYLASEPMQLALVRDNAELVAIVLDRSRGVTLARVSAGGTQRNRVQLGGPDAAFEEIAVAGEHIVARTADQVIEAYGSDGRLRGRLVPEPGQRVTDLAARNGRIAALVTTKETSALRWITLHPRGLTWTAPLTLPSTPRDDRFAIAPSRKRIAYIAQDTNGLHVLDLDSVPTLVFGTRVHADAADKLGFIDDDTLGLVGPQVQWWRAQSADEPEPTAELKSFPHVGQTEAAAFADGVAVYVATGALALARPSGTKYLGWRVSSLGSLQALDDHIVLSSGGSRFLWLDDDLQPVRRFELGDRRIGGASWSFGQPLGEHHAIVQAYHGASSELYLVDADRPDEPVRIMEKTKSFETYFVSNGILAVRAGRQLRRFQLDLATTTATEMLPAIRISDYSLSAAHVFDPADADGLVAVTLGWPTMNSVQTVLTYYRLVNGKIVKSRPKQFSGQLLRASPDGTLAVVTYSDGQRVRLIKNDEVLREFSHTTMTTPIVLGKDATRVMYRDGHDVVMLDEAATEVWRAPVWGASTLQLTPNGRRLIISTMSGLVALDAATGAQVTTECAFDFGLHDKPGELAMHGFRPVCEDPIVQ